MKSSNRQHGEESRIICIIHIPKETIELIIFSFVQSSSRYCNARQKEFWGVSLANNTIMSGRVSPFSQFTRPPSHRPNRRDKKKASKVVDLHKCSWVALPLLRDSPTITLIPPKQMLFVIANDSIQPLNHIHCTLVLDFP